MMTIVVKPQSLRFAAEPEQRDCCLPSGIAKAPGAQLSGSVLCWRLGGPPQLCALTPGAVLGSSPLIFASTLQGSGGAHLTDEGLAQREPLGLPSGRRCGSLHGSARHPHSPPLASSVQLIPRRGNRRSARKEGWKVGCRADGPWRLVSSEASSQCTSSSDLPTPGPHAQLRQVSWLSLSKLSGKLACVWPLGS